MRNALSWICFFLVFLCVSASTPLLAASIVPGRSIGKIHLGASRRTVVEAIGKPAHSTATKAGYQVDEWLSKTTIRPWGSNYKPPQPNFLRVTYRKRRVVQIEVTSPHFSTWNGISTRHEKIYPIFKKLYKPYKSDIMDMGGLVDYYDDRRNGIAFSVYTPSGPVSLLFSVIIHRLNTSVIYPNDAKPAKKPVRDYKWGN